MRFLPRSRRRAQMALEARFEALQSSRCVCVGVSLKYCVSLEATPPAASSLGTCSSTGARPNSVNPHRAMCCPSILITRFSSRLNYNTLRGAHRTCSRPIDHLQRFLPPGPPNGQLYIIGTPLHILSSVLPCLVLVSLRFPFIISTFNTSVRRM